LIHLNRRLTNRVFGLAVAYHTLSLAIEQLTIKVIALQWIFGCLRNMSILTVAFVISGVVALLSILVIIPSTRRAVENAAASTQAQVDSGVDETSRLLGGSNA